jgi:hypothetical protein
MRSRAFAQVNAHGRRLAFFVALTVAGCNHAPYPTAPVSGTVTIDGQPMTGGMVMFAPVAKDGLNSGRPAFAEIQADGRYTLRTYSDGDGAVVGEHWVSIVNGRPTAGDSDWPPVRQVALNAGGPVNKLNFQRIVFPRKVVSVVADRDNQIDIAMTSQDIARYGKLSDSDD